MTTQHTEGPLRVTETFDLESQDGFTVAVSVDCAQFDADGMTTTENARRLAACWNALQGVPTEVLEEAVKLGIGHFNDMVLFENLLKWKRQRDQLQELNAALVAALEEIVAEEWRDDDDPILDCARSKAREALAKARRYASTRLAAEIGRSMP